jgi:hypothetical protein
MEQEARSLPPAAAAAAADKIDAARVQLQALQQRADKAGPSAFTPQQVRTWAMPAYAPAGSSRPAGPPLRSRMRGGVGERSRARAAAAQRCYALPGGLPAPSHEHNPTPHAPGHAAGLHQLHRLPARARAGGGRAAGRGVGPPAAGAAAARSGGGARLRAASAAESAAAARRAAGGAEQVASELPIAARHPFTAQPRALDHPTPPHPGRRQLAMRCSLSWRGSGRQSWARSTRLTARGRTYSKRRAR